MKTVTLLFLKQDNKILLAMKKRGHGEGKWNGVGGKLEPNETVLAAAIRECQEEIGITPIKPQLAGRLHFFELTEPDFHHHCHIFAAETWHGDPAETEEMSPRWFHINDIPYDEMWADDILWLPHLLEGRKFSGKITLNAGRVHRHSIIVKT